jgi:hypothetical protein
MEEPQNIDGQRATTVHESQQYYQQQSQTNPQKNRNNSQPQNNSKSSHQIHNSTLSSIDRTQYEMQIT